MSDPSVVLLQTIASLKLQLRIHEENLKSLQNVYEQYLPLQQQIITTRKLLSIIQSNFREELVALRNEKVNRIKAQSRVKFLEHKIRVCAEGV